MQLALPRCTATDSLWRRNVVDRGSNVTAAIRRPSSVTNSSACSPQTPDVSMATGTKSMPVMTSAYFCCFFLSAAVAAEPACVLLECTWDNANVSWQVASHARHRSTFFPWNQYVTPSGRFPPLGYQRLPLHIKMEELNDML